MKDLARLAGPLGFMLSFARVPLSPAAASIVAADASIAPTILGGGDDYELLVAVPPDSVTGFQDGAKAAGIEVSDLGALSENIPLHVVDSAGTAIKVERFGYDHFSR
jgi:thiamine-monophosphate kinase